MSGFVSAAAMLATAVTIVVTMYVAGALVAGSRQVVVAGPFESGLRPTVHAVSRFHVRWYAATLVFLAFDVEMLFMYPWALVVSSVGPGAIVEMFVFLGVLMAGVTYAWREGVFRWS